MGSCVLLATEAAQQGGFGFNPNLLEANVINLALVIGLLVYFGRGFLGNLLGDRRKAIESEILEAEGRRDKAAKALTEQQGKLAQAKAEAERLIKDAQHRSEVLREEILRAAADEVRRMQRSAAQDLQAEQERVVQEIRQQVVAKAMQQVGAQLPQRMDETTHQQIIDRSLATLGGRS